MQSNPMADRLPPGIRMRQIENGNGLTMACLEAGDADQPVILLLHGFPELAFSWRRIMLTLAALGYRVIAPDQRGYGATQGWSDNYDADLSPFGLFNLVTDLVGLLQALEIDQVAAVVGHDFGSPVAAWASLTRPDLFQRVVLMSAPFAGPPRLAHGGAGAAAGIAAASHLGDALATLDPPRQHYQAWYRSREANSDMLHCPQGVAAFLRAYFHQKSGDWPGNQPFPLPDLSAESLALLPEYYVMPLDKGMAATVAPEMPDADTVAHCDWLPDDDLAVYAEAFSKSGFQGGLNWYRAAADSAQLAQQQLYAGAQIRQPCCFIAGAKDWGIHQIPGALGTMSEIACADFRGTRLIPGAGHWVQQEAPDQVVAELFEFLGR